jgi:hypothetical protein
MELSQHILYCAPRDNCREDFDEVHAFTALRFTATGASLAAKRTQILMMTQHAFGMKGSFTFLHRSQEVLKMLSL